MPGFDGTGPMGMGPMTGGARGWCNPYGQGVAGPGFRRVPGRGGGRGFRNMYWATGLPGRVRPYAGGFWGSPFSAPYTSEQEISLLKSQAEALKAELDAISARLQDLEKPE